MAIVKKTFQIIKTWFQTNLNLCLLFYFLFSLLTISVSGLICSISGIQNSEYYSMMLSFNQGGTLVQECKSTNFLQGNNFYVGYYFNYFYGCKTNKTYFINTSYDVNPYVFFSSNTGMTKTGYSAPEICGINVKEGKMFSSDWNENECYLTESYFYEYYGEKYSNSKNYEFKNNLSICGIIDDKSVSFLTSAYSNKIVFVSFNFACSELSTNSNLETRFIGSDYLGTKRYLDHYFARYVGNAWNNSLKLNVNSNVFEIKKQINTNYFGAIVLVVFNSGTITLAFWIVKKKKIQLKPVNYFLYLLIFFLIRIFFNLLSPFIVSNINILFGTSLENIFSLSLALLFCFFIQLVFNQFDHKEMAEHDDDLFFISI